MHKPTRTTKRQSKSCKRCLRRKQRCHGFPICKNCEDAGQPCEQSDFARQLHQNDGAQAAYHRIRTLEAQLDDALSRLRAASPCPAEPVAAQPSLEQIVQATVWKKALPSADLEHLHPIQGYGQRQNLRPPDDEKGRRMVQAYLDKMHPRYPFLDRVELQKLHAQSQTAACVDRFDTFKLNMVYAIGASLMQLTEPVAGAPEPHDFFMAALPHISSVGRAHTQRSVEAMTLLVLYSLRSPYNSGIWYMVGHAMRSCIDLGLHREASYSAPGSSQYQNEMRRRLFWSVYLLERIIALSLKRPFSISERDIDSRIPIDVRDPLPAHDGFYSASSPYSDFPTLAMWIKFIQIKRLESTIYSELHCASLNSDTPMLLSSIAPFVSSLDAWAASLPALSLTRPETSYAQLQYNKSMVLLLRPFLATVPKAHPLIARCLDACGQMCEAFKQMHQRDAYGHSFISAHSNFIAGVTLCYCLCLSPDLYTPAVANRLRACSSTMFVMAERSPQLRRHRDILEDVMDHVMDALQSPQPPRSSPASTSVPTASAAANISYDGLDGGKTPGEQQQQQQLSPGDIMAVRSLMDLAAQQDPPRTLNEAVSSSSSPSIVMPATDIWMSPASEVRGQEAAPFDELAASASTFPGGTGSIGALDLWDHDRYSSQMLDEMVAMDSWQGVN